MGTAMGAAFVISEAPLPKMGSKGTLAERVAEAGGSMVEAGAYHAVSFDGPNTLSNIVSILEARGKQRDAMWELEDKQLEVHATWKKCVKTCFGLLTDWETKKGYYRYNTGVKAKLNDDNYEAAKAAAKTKLFK